MSNNYMTEEEEEEAYYRWVQERMEEEERAKQRNAVTEVAPTKVPALSTNTRVVSLGITSHVAQSPRDVDARKRAEKSEKFMKYQAQMQEDQQRVIEETRKPYIRKNYDDEPEEKFFIGKSVAADVMRREKREAQATYMRQLQADQHRKQHDVVPERRSLAPPTYSNPNTGRSTGTYMEIGRDEEYDKIVKRRAAIEVQIRNTEAIQQKLMEGSGSPNKNKKEPLYSSRESDQRAFEDANYHFIGEREGNDRSRRTQVANEYRQQLNDDANGVPVPYRTNYRPDNDYAQTRYADEEPEVDGLNIGGVSIGGKKLESKQAAQARYRQQLDTQKLHDEEARRRSFLRNAQRELR